MMFPSSPVQIVRRIPGTSTGTDGDLMQDNLGRWWQYDRGPICAETAITQRAVIDQYGYLHPKT
jgi:hypothetical protein